MINVHLKCHFLNHFIFLIFFLYTFELPANITVMFTRMAAGLQSYIIVLCCGERLTNQTKTKMMNFPTKIPLLVYLWSVWIRTVDRNTIEDTHSYLSLQKCQKILQWIKTLSKRTIQLQSLLLAPKKWEYSFPALNILTVCMRTIQLQSILLSPNN